MHQWPTMKIELCIFSFQAISILKISGVIRILCMIRGSGGTLTIISDVRDEIAASKMLSLGSLKARNLYNCPPREQIANEIYHAFAITVTVSQAASPLSSLTILPEASCMLLVTIAYV